VRPRGVATSPRRTPRPATLPSAAQSTCVDGQGDGHQGARPAGSVDMRCLSLACSTDRQRRRDVRALAVVRDRLSEQHWVSYVGADRATRARVIVGRRYGTRRGDALWVPRVAVADWSVRVHGEVAAGAAGDLGQYLFLIEANDVSVPDGGAGEGVHSNVGFDGVDALRHDKAVGRRIGARGHDWRGCRVLEGAFVWAPRQSRSRGKCRILRCVCWWRPRTPGCAFGGAGVRGA